MKQNRTILHSDLNCFFASVELLLNPSLRGKPVAVCGNTEERHGIVLAKSEEAKRAGVKTAMPNWQARQLCPELVLVPPQYAQYQKYSKLVNAFYREYTDRVEPFGMDECWLDLTGCTHACGEGPEAAETIRRRLREEIGLTVSVGVSFNKVFAKLGSDMKKPDATTVIGRENFRELVWPLKASELLYVGRATVKKLADRGIYTIGDIARATPEFMRRLLGVNGLAIWNYAAGYDTAQVMPANYTEPAKSMGHGVTCTADLVSDEEVWRVLLELTQQVGHRLRIHEQAALGLSVSVRDTQLITQSWQTRLAFPTQSPRELAERGTELFAAHYDWRRNVRAVSITATHLVPADTPGQIGLFDDIARREKQERLDDAVESIRNRFGPKAIQSAALLLNTKLPAGMRPPKALPGMMYR